MPQRIAAPEAMALAAVDAEIRRAKTAPIEDVPMFRKIMPEMSQTERDAIEAGTVWWDAELFSGRPNWSRLLSSPPPRLLRPRRTTSREKRSLIVRAWAVRRRLGTDDRT